MEPQNQQEKRPEERQLEQQLQTHEPQPQSQKPLRWAIIGCGSVSQDFTRAIRIADRIHQVTVAGASSMECARQFKNTLFLSDNTKLFGDHVEAVESHDDYDIAYIGAYSPEHSRLVDLALDAGKHVLCERPLAPSAAVARQLVEKARQNNCFLMEGYWSRFFPTWQKIREDRQQLGKLYLVQASLCYDKQRSASYDMPTHAFFASPSVISLKSWNAASQNDAESAPKEEKPSQNHLSVNYDGNAGSRNSSRGSSAERAQPEKQKMATASDSGDCTGIEYTVNFALWVFDGEMPTRITATGKSNEQGQDLWGCVTLEFSENRVASLFYSTQHSSYSPAIVVGENGTLQLPDRFWCATEMVVEQGIPRGTATNQTLRFPIRKDSRGYRYPNGNAFYFEADHVYDCIANGKLESDVMSLDESLKIAEITDEIRAKISALNLQ